MKTTIIIEIESSNMKTIYSVPPDVEDLEQTKDNEIQADVEKNIHENIDESVRRFVNEEMEYEVLDGLELGVEGWESFIDYGNIKISIITEKHGKKD